MQIAVRANDFQKREFIDKGHAGNIIITWLNEIDDLLNVKAEIYFDLLFDEIDVSKNRFIKNSLVFANAVIATCAELPSNYIRINGWSGFLKRDVIEVSALNKTTINEAENIFEKLGWKYQFVFDEPGMISARIISMIINEAYFALGDKISTKAEIDLAMKLGTNYPYGPFEWSEKIGLAKIYFLLKKLSRQSNRYLISKNLEEEYNELA